jgi:glycine dehydrogenase subunit 1
MRYLPHTDDDVRAMLAAVGVADVGDLFSDVPSDLRGRATVGLPPGLSEQEVRARLEQLAARNRTAAQRCFLGAGI